MSTYLLTSRAPTSSDAANVRSPCKATGRGVNVVGPSPGSDMLGASSAAERRADVVVRMRPSAEEEAAAAASTKAVLEQIVDAKIRSTRPGHIAETAQSRAEESKCIRYTPAPDAPGYNPATAQRVIRMVEAPIDPFEPSKFKHKKVPGGPGDAPVPIMRRCGAGVFRRTSPVSHRRLLPLTLAPPPRPRAARRAS